MENSDIQAFDELYDRNDLKLEQKETKLLCPSCKNDTFIRKGSELIHMFESESGIRDEPFDIAEDYRFFCSECNKEVTEEKLIKEEEQDD